MNWFVKNGKANFGRTSPTEIFRSEETEMELPFDFRDLWQKYVNTSGLHVFVHGSMASEVMEIFPLFFLFLPIRQIL